MDDSFITDRQLLPLYTSTPVRSETGDSDCYETHKISNLPLDVKGYMLPPEPKLYHSPIVSQILLNYIKIEDTTQTKRGQGWLGLK